MGERTPLALLDAAGLRPHGRRRGADQHRRRRRRPRSRDVQLSANWMAACGAPGEDAALYDTVQAVGRELCPALGIAIPVGKDSLSMRPRWQTRTARPQRSSRRCRWSSPPSRRVGDVRRTLTPQLRHDCGATAAAADRPRRRPQPPRRLGLAQVYGAARRRAARPGRPARCSRRSSPRIAELRGDGLLLAYHDRSDGGLFATLCEMAFAGRCGLDIDTAGVDGDDASRRCSPRSSARCCRCARGPSSACVARSARRTASATLLRSRRQPATATTIGSRRGDGRTSFDESRTELRRAWSETDLPHAGAARQPGLRATRSTQRRDRRDRPGPAVRTDASIRPRTSPRPTSARGARPRVAILREQGVNGQVEMAAAFDRAGFERVDVHMTDLLAGRARPRRLQAAWSPAAASPTATCSAPATAGPSRSCSTTRCATQFDARSSRARTPSRSASATAARCCRRSRELIPGAEHWPRFVRNRSEQFEARLGLVEVLPSPSLLLDGMAGSLLPIAVAHGEGRADFDRRAALERWPRAGHGRAALRRQPRPAGRHVSRQSQRLARRHRRAVTSRDGRVTIMMPHPERVFRTVQHSWHPPGWGDDGPVAADVPQRARLGRLS